MYLSLSNPVPRVIAALFLLLILLHPYTSYAQAKKAYHIDELGIIDLHSHPSLKIYLWGHKIWKKHNPIPGGNVVRMQVDTRGINAGFMKGMIATHYLPEMGLARESNVLKTLFPIVRRICPSLANKFEHEDKSNFTQTNLMIDLLEEQIYKANQRPGIEIVIARNYEEFEKAINEGKMPIAHAIEGFHGLGRSKPNSTLRKKVAAYEDQYKGYAKTNNVKQQNDLITQITKEVRKDTIPVTRIKVRKALEGFDGPDPAEVEAMFMQNLHALKERGVCMITLAHFFKNDLVIEPVEGISPDEKKNQKIWRRYNPAANPHITPLGTKLVEEMFKIGVVVDITHTNQQVRSDVFALSAKYKKPVIFSHAGARAIFDKYGAAANKDYGYYCLDSNEIKAINKCGGVIGVIPEIFWLAGCNKHLKECKASDFQKGIPYMVETIKYIEKLTDSIDNIAIGTDFDGLADVPKDIYKPSQLGALIDALKEAKYNDEQIKAMMHGNTLRVLKNGWN